VSLAYVDAPRSADFLARALDLALRMGDKERVGYALTTEAIALASFLGGGRDRVWKVVQQAKRIGEETSSPFLEGMALAAEGHARYFAGELREALVVLERADTVFRERTTGTAYESASVRLMRIWALRHLGDLVTMRHAFGECVRDAARRGDDYFETTLCRSGNLVWLALDDPGAAKRDLERTRWTPVSQAFHLQHWYLLRARAEIDLYRGDGARAMSEAVGPLHDLRRSLLIRLKTVRVESQWLAGRLALASAELDAEPRRRIADAARMAKKLVSHSTPFVKAWGHLLEAGVAHQRGQTGVVIDRLAATIEVAEENDLVLVSAVARYRRAQIEPGQPSALAEASALLVRIGAAHPARMANVFAPGFAPRARGLLAAGP
jgi:hypothetical protein